MPVNTYAGSAFSILCAVIFLFAGCDAGKENSAPSIDLGEYYKDASVNMKKALQELIDSIKENNIAEDDNNNVMMLLNNKVTACLENISSDNDAQIASNLFYDLVVANNDFILSDYYLIWLGHSILTEYPPQDVNILHTLVYKVNNARSTLSVSARSEWNQMVAEILQEILSNRGIDAGFVVSGKFEQEKWSEADKMLDLAYSEL